MASYDRLRRREAHEGPESRQQAPAPAPDVASILALQRSAGNRALQRMLYVADAGKLSVPPAYGSQIVQWDDQNKRLRKPARTDPTDKTLVKLAESNATFRDQLRKGMNVDKLETVEVADERAVNKATWEQAASPAKDALAEARRVAPDQNRLLFFRAAWDKFTELTDLDVRWVLSAPDDFVPSKGDLIGADKPLSTWTGEGPRSNTGWKMACVLIALVKHEGNGFAAKVHEITNETPTSDKDAVQKLHKYYAGRGNVQYDDTATRFEMMNRWGYDPIFTAGCAWADLPKHVALFRNKKYIFDIQGHTVVVRPNKDIPKDGSTIKDPTKVLEPDSLGENYARGTEFNEAIKFIWEKQ